MLIRDLSAKVLVHVIADALFDADLPDENIAFFRG